MITKLLLVRHVLFGDAFAFCDFFVSGMVSLLEISFVS